MVDSLDCRTGAGLRTADHRPVIWSTHASYGHRRPHPGRVAPHRPGDAYRDDPQGLDRRPHPADRGGRQARRADPRAAGDLQRSLLLSLAGRALVRHRRARARADHRADGGLREEVPDGDGRAGLRARAGGRLLQHRRGLRQRRHATSGSTGRTTSRTRPASGRSTSSSPGTSGIRSSRRGSRPSASTSATTGTSRRAPGCSG